MNAYTNQIIECAKNINPWMYYISVIENGKLTTLSINPANKTNDCYSISKVFTVTALGLLYDDGKLDTAEKIVDIFKDELPDYMDPKWERVTVDMVIRHCWGITHGFLDIDVEDIDSYQSIYGTRNDFLKIILSHELGFEPGGKEVYSDAAYYLLSRVVTKKSGEILYEFLRKRLFNPLDFEETAWSCCPMGYTIGATGLYIRTGDMAKLGQLYISNGEYNGRRIISEEWCNTVLARGYELRSFGSGYAKGGMYGQLLYIDPSRNLVVAWVGHDRTDASAKMREFICDLS